MYIEKWGVCPLCEGSCVYPKDESRTTSYIGSRVMYELTARENRANAKGKLCPLCDGKGVVNTACPQKTYKIDENGNAIVKDITNIIY